MDKYYEIARYIVIVNQGVGWDDIPYLTKAFAVLRAKSLATQGWDVRVLGKRERAIVWKKEGTEAKA